MIFDEENFPVLPEHWRNLPVESACSLISIKTKIKQKEYLPAGKLPVVDQGADLVGGYTNDLSAAVQTEFPVIVFGDHTRVLKYIDFAFAAGADGIKILRPMPGFHPRVFYHFLRAIRLPDKGYARHFQHLRDARIALPPEGEQKRIADKLDRLLAAVDTCKARLDAIPEILKRFRQSVLAAAVSGELTEEWRGSDQAHELEGMVLPASWAAARAAKACAKVQSGGTPRGKPFSVTGDVPFLKVYNIVDQRIEFDSKPQFVARDVHEGELRKSIGYPGDVVMNIVGPPLGKVAILESEFPEWNMNQAMTLFRPDSSVLTSQFLYYFLCEGALVRDVMHQTRGSVGQVNISLTQCRDAFIPLPPLLEQQEIARRVNALFALANEVQAQVARATTHVDNLTQSILAKAFRGELASSQPSELSVDRARECMDDFGMCADRAARTPSRKVAS